MKILNRKIWLTIFIAGMMSQGYAACDIPSPPSAGSNVTCTGATIGTYRVINENVTITNDGNWTGTLPSNAGSVFGASYGSNSETNGFKLVNDGTMDFDVTSISSGYAGTTISAVSVNWRVPFANLSGIYTMENNGSISFTDTATASDTDVMAISNAYVNGQGTITNSVGSTISVTSDSNHTTAVGSSGGNVINNGIISATSNGYAQARGVNLLTTFSSSYDTIDTEANLLNTGEVYVVAADVDTTLLAGVNFGSAAVWVSSVTESTVENQGILSFDMSGTFSDVDEVGTVLFSDGYANILNGSVNYLSNNFTNSGEVRTIGHDIAINSVFKMGNAPSIIIQNQTTGLIDGRIFTSSEIDTIQNSGEITGNIVTREGDDSVFLLDSSKTADVDLGDGSDRLRVTDIPSSIGRLDGGGNAIIGDEVNNGSAWDDRLTFEGFSGIAPLMLNWENVNLTTNTNIIIPNNTDMGALLIDSSSKLTVTDAISLKTDVTNNGVFSTTDNSTDDTPKIDGNISGGTIQIDINPSNHRSDVLLITGDNTGILAFDLVNIDVSGSSDKLNIPLATVGGIPGDAVILGGNKYYTVNNVMYELQLIGNTWVLVVLPQPTITVAGPIEGDNIIDSNEQSDVMINGKITNVEPGQVVTIIISDGVSTVTATATVDAGGNWSTVGIDMSNLADGLLTVKATVTNLSGQIANGSSIVTKKVTNIVTKPIVTKPIPVISLMGLFFMLVLITGSVFIRGTRQQ